MDYETIVTDMVESLPEIQSAFIFDTNAGVPIIQIGQLIPDDNTLAISKTMSQINTIASMQYSDISSLKLRFADTVLIACEINDLQWLYILHDSSLSPGMLRMTLGMTLTALKEAEFEGEPTVVFQADDDALEAEEPVIDPEALMAEGSELHVPLTEMELELAQFIGPVAQVVFNDSVIKWAEIHEPVKDNLTYLVNLLAEEIGDEDDMEAYTKQFAKYM